MHLELKLADGGHERVEVDEGHSLNDELDLFLHRQGKYETGWVPIGAGASYVRYEQVAEVRPVA
jgi:hypothetical protein